jgi:hypothetical protein
MGENYRSYRKLLCFFFILCLFNQFECTCDFSNNPLKGNYTGSFPPNTSTQCSYDVTCFTLFSNSTNVLLMECTFSGGKALFYPFGTSINQCLGWSGGITRFAGQCVNDQIIVHDSTGNISNGGIVEGIYIICGQGCIRLS